jgi:hypothetical protein
MTEVYVNFPNEGEHAVPVYVVNKWHPKLVTALEDYVFFWEKDVHLGMRRTDYEEIFGKILAS